MRTPLGFLVPLLLAAATACLAEPPDQDDAPATPLRQGPPVHSFGAMREVLRDGRTEARVALEDVLSPDTVAVGATEGLAAEITIDRGAVHLAEVVREADPSLRSIGVRRDATGERATLLITAEVETWEPSPLSPVEDLAALEDAVRAAALAAGIDPAKPLPFRVEGTASALQLHVLDHSCPIAHPEGPAPWRFDGQAVPVQLVGFYAEDAGGVLTHHGQRSHVHAVLPEEGVAGHVDAVRFEGMDVASARLFLPALR